MALDIEARRCFSRISLRAPLRYQVRGKPEAYNAVCDNISKGGLCFNCDKFITPLSTLMLEINLLSRVLKPIGKVAWAQDISRSYTKRIGVEFVEFDPSEKNFLGDFIDLQTNNL